MCSKITIANASSALLQLAGQLRPQVDGGIVISIGAELTNGIYKACTNSCEVKTIIADDNINYENLALQAEDNELNLNCNKAEKRQPAGGGKASASRQRESVSKSVRHDSKKMLDRIDWKGKEEVKTDNKVNESQIKT